MPAGSTSGFGKIDVRGRAPSSRPMRSIVQGPDIDCRRSGRARRYGCRRWWIARWAAGWTTEVPAQGPVAMRANEARFRRGAFGSVAESGSAARPAAGGGSGHHRPRTGDEVRRRR